MGRQLLPVAETQIVATLTSLPGAPTEVAPAATRPCGPATTLSTRWLRGPLITCWSSGTRAHWTSVQGTGSAGGTAPRGGDGTVSPPGSRAMRNVTTPVTTIARPNNAAMRGAVARRGCGSDPSATLGTALSVGGLERRTNQPPPMLRSDPCH